MSSATLIGATIQKRLSLRRHITIIALGLSLTASCLLAMSVGALTIPLDHILDAIAAKFGLVATTEIFEQAALFDIRLPRLVLGLCVGATLGICGAALQALFRNALADPGLLGVSSGAACGAVGWIVLGGTAPLWMHTAITLPLMSFVMALAATGLVYFVAASRRRSDGATLLLAGIAVNALGSAVVGFLTYLGNDAQLRSLTFWLLGGLSGVTWHEILPLLPVFAISLGGLLLLARSFDVLALGEAAAGHLGLPVETTRRITMALTAFGVGASVALTGIIGFVGLASPHLVRLIGGPRHNFVLPAAALMGALLTVLADIFARTVVVPAELPIGVVTSAVGAPFFIWLLKRRSQP
jgi:iron complex transport system permease protein